MGKVSDSIVHEEIIKRGLTQSVVRYFYNQTNSSKPINLAKINNEYYDLTNLYYDYYGKIICEIPLEKLIINNFQPSVAVVDIDSKTKDLPYAHFDAEKFAESNARVINFTNAIRDKLKSKNYTSARKLSGQSN